MGNSLTTITETYNGQSITYVKSTENTEKGNVANANIGGAIGLLSSMNASMAANAEIVPKGDEGYDVLAQAVIDGLNKVNDKITERQSELAVVQQSITDNCKELDDVITAANRQAAINALPKGDKKDEVSN